MNLQLRAKGQSALSAAPQHAPPPSEYNHVTQPAVQQSVAQPAFQQSSSASAYVSESGPEAAEEGYRFEEGLIHLLNMNFLFVYLYFYNFSTYVYDVWGIFHSFL